MREDTHFKSYGCFPDSVFKVLFNHLYSVFSDNKEEEKRENKKEGKKQSFKVRT